MNEVPIAQFLLASAIPDYEVSMFSGGWKMRIGLGKVLLKGMS